MGYILTGDQQKTALKRIGEIIRQFGQDEYPYDPEHALDALQAFHEGRFEAVGAAIQQPILRLISGGERLVIDETDGTETISGATDVFPGGIDPNFVNWGADEPSVPTGKMPVSVYGLARDATFSQMVGSVSAYNDYLCLTPSQVVGFVRKYPNWLRAVGYGTFFPYKSGRKRFVAYVRFVDRGLLGVDVNRFERDDVWRAESRRRLVLPQLTLGR